MEALEMLCMYGHGLEGRWRAEKSETEQIRTL